MNRRLRKLRREIERRGGVVHVEPTLPDDLAELFLREILDCPECMAEARRAQAFADLSRAEREH